MVEVQPFMGGKTIQVRIFGNDDNDPTRGMSTAEGNAARSGGTLNPKAG